MEIKVGDKILTTAYNPEDVRYTAEIIGIVEVEVKYENGAIGYLNVADFEVVEQPK